MLFFFRNILIFSDCVGNINSKYLVFNIRRNHTSSTVAFMLFGVGVICRSFYSTVIKLFIERLLERDY